MFTNTNHNIKEFRKDFPILLKPLTNNKTLSYLDNGATTQKPSVVINCLTDYYKNYNANVHRGIHTLSEQSTTMYEDARAVVASHIHANKPEEIVFVRGCTEAINVVAHAFLLNKLQPGDNIVLTIMEHHANIVPWQTVAKMRGANLRVVPIDQKGDLCVKTYEKLLDDKTKMVAFSHISNVLGSISPAKYMIQKAHEKGIPVLVDGAQAISHMDIDVVDLDADFYTFSAHKAFGPTGVGILYAKYKHLEKMIPYQTGGGMIEKVSFERSTYAKAPYKFEAGTPNIAGAIGMAKACKYIQSVGYESIKAYEEELAKELTATLSTFPNITVYGTTKNKVPIASFTMKDIHAHDIATILDSEGVAVRAGHHCTMPLMKSFGIAATTRASLAFYNNQDDIRALENGLRKVQEVFNG